MQITCPGCGQQLPIDHQHLGTTIQCGGCDSLVVVPSAPPAVMPQQSVPKPIAAPRPAQNYPPPPARSNRRVGGDHSIVIAALCCLVGLILLFAIGIVWVATSEDSVQANATGVETQSQATTTPEAARSRFEEGYSMELPPGFKLQQREETESGNIIYRFRNEQGYRFTLAMIHSETYDVYFSPPTELSKALVASIPELRDGVEGVMEPERVNAGGMPATVFRYYERETYRGILFTYHMVAIDRGRKLVLRFSGKYRGYSDQEENIEMPTEWYRSLRSLQKERPVNR